MKKTLLTLAMATVSYCSYAQSTFPTDGSNVGIGTTSPSYPLTLNSAGETGILTIDGGTSVYLSHGGWSMGAGKFGIGNGYTPTLVVSANANGGTSAGNVGIGTVSPSYPLTINNTTSAHIDLTGGSSQNGILFEPVSSANQFYLYNGNSDANPGFGLYDNTVGKWRIWVNNSGNMGIGTTSPNVPLQFGNAGSFPYPIVGLYDGGTSVKYGLGISLSGAIDGAGGLTAYAGDRGFVIRNDNITGMENFSVDHTGDTYVRGNVAIGTTDPHGYKLAVDGSVIATSVTVKLYADWPDYVFKKNYKLPSLTTVKTYIDKNKHLPDMPSEKEVTKNGINLGEVVKVQTKKIEELTLYAIQQDVRIAALEAALAKLTNSSK